MKASLLVPAEVSGFAPHKIISFQAEVVSADLSLCHSADPEVRSPSPTLLLVWTPLGDVNQATI